MSWLTSILGSSASSGTANTAASSATTQAASNTVAQGAATQAASGGIGQALGDVAKEVLVNRASGGGGGGGSGAGRGADAQSGGAQQSIGSLILERRVDREFQRRLGVSLDEILAVRRSQGQTQQSAVRAR